MTSTENLSHGGAYFVSPHPYRLDARLRVAIPFTLGAKLEEASARVARVIPQDDGRFPPDDDSVPLRLSDPGATRPMPPAVPIETPIPMSQPKPPSSPLPPPREGNE